jgi:general secretion pathway protein D
MADFKAKHRFSKCLLAFSTLLLLYACAAGTTPFKKGKQLEAQQQYDEALANYEQALKLDPKNHEYRLYYERARFQTALSHFDRGRKLRESGNLDESLVEFQRASAIDPSNALAMQEVKKV